MIKVQRGPQPWVLRDPRGPAARERAKAAAFFAKQPADPEERDSFPFAVYSDPEVKDALERLFHGKCAYCEAKYSETQPMDVEHWRPKARVLEEDGQTYSPGYYWLASEWKNLLPSCIDCNRQRMQVSGVDSRERASGKGERFPLADPARRAKVKDAEESELPLLLNPCEDDPEEHLEFNELAIVIPRTVSNEPSRKARLSIDVYGLNRIGLVDERLQVLVLMKYRFATILRLIALLDRAPHERIAAAIEDLLAHEMVELKRFADRRRPFSSMARQFIARCTQRLESLCTDAQTKETHP